MLSGLSLRPSLEQGQEQLKQAQKSITSRLELPVESGCLGLLFRRQSDGLTLPFRCDGWDCSECGPRKGNRVARAMRLGCLEHGLGHLITLTLPGRGHRLRGDPIASREAVGPMWNSLRTYLRKHGQLGEDYITVPEWQKDGTCHLHLATDRRISWDVLSKAWARLGGGFTWCSPQREMRNPEDVGREIAKYLTKVQANPKATPTTWVCKEGGGFRRRPWHRYWPSRPVGRTISRFLEDARQDDAVDPPPDDVWEVVVPVEGGEGIVDYPPFKGHILPNVEECHGHLWTDTDCCHGDPPWTKCLCGGPAVASLNAYIPPSDSTPDGGATSVIGGIPSHPAGAEGAEEGDAPRRRNAVWLNGRVDVGVVENV